MLIQITKSDGELSIEGLYDKYHGPFYIHINRTNTSKLSVLVGHTDGNEYILERIANKLGYENPDIDWGTGATTWKNWHFTVTKERLKKELPIILDMCIESVYHSRDEYPELSDDNLSYMLDIIFPEEEDNETTEKIYAKFKEQLAQALRKYRSIHGITQDEFASLVSLSKHTIVNLENDAAETNPRITTILNIIAALAGKIEINLNDGLKIVVDSTDI